MPSFKQALRPLRGAVYWAERQAYFADVFSLRGLTLPHFLGLGAGQSGTTWLYENLSCHPGVFMAEPKETHYFTRKFNKWSLSQYASLYADSGDRVRGEITPGYNVLQPDRIRQIHKIVPEARLILLVRNPVERAWSAARRHCSQWADISGQKFDDLDDEVFYDYFRTEWMSWFDPPRSTYHFTPGLLQGHFTKQLDQWLSVFPEEQLFVGFFDDLKENPKDLLTGIFQHIGVSTEIDWSLLPLGDVVNKNPSHTMPERFRGHLEELYADEIDRLRRRFDGPTRRWTSPGRAQG